MSNNYASTNRFESLAADGETPGKRLNTMTTPDRFKSISDGNPGPDGTGTSMLAVQDKQVIERINGAKSRPPPPPRQELAGKKQGNRDGPPGLISAWAKPLPRAVSGAGPRKSTPKKKLPIVKSGPAVKALKVEKKNRASQEDNEFLKGIMLEAPEIAAVLSKQLEAEDRPMFTVELVCTPDQTWVSEGDAPDLSNYASERGLLQDLAALAGQDSAHTIKLEPIKSVKIEGLLRKKHFYQLGCSSEENLGNIVTHDKALSWKGYTLTYFQQKDSRFGYRFQYALGGIPAPFKDYSISDWLQVLLSQGWDVQAITYITFGVISIPGEMSMLTGMLDIWVKPEACINHSCDGALAFAGTDAEALGKKIEHPPSAIVLGWNPSEEASELISQGLCVGQYHSDMPWTRPRQDEFNAMLESQTDSYLQQSDFGKTFLRKTVKVGACMHCWGPPHANREKCLYKGTCRECLAVLAELPNKGFHHACRSLIISTVKTVKVDVSTKRKAGYDPGTPLDPSMAVYIPSESAGKRQKIIEMLKVKQLKRKHAESEARDQAKADQDAAELAEFESLIHEDPDYVLTAAEREEQDKALADLPDTIMLDEDDDI
jgi:hypothetical protein